MEEKIENLENQMQKMEEDCTELMLKTEKHNQPLTTAQIAKITGLDKETIRQRFVKKGLTPVKKGVVQRGESDLWDYQALLDLEEEEERSRKLAIKRATSIVETLKSVKGLKKVDEQTVITNALSEIGTQQVFDNYINRIRTDVSPDTTKEIINNAAGFIQMLMERAVILNNTLDEKDKKIEELTYNMDIRCGDTHPDWLSIDRVLEYCGINRDDNITYSPDGWGASQSQKVKNILSSLSETLGYEVKKIELQWFPTRNKYHIEVVNVAMAAIKAVR